MDVDLTQYSEHQMWGDDDAWPSMTLRYGGLVGSELQDVVWAVYGVAFHVHVPFLTPDGDFTIERDDENAIPGRSEEP